MAFEADINYRRDTSAQDSKSLKSTPKRVGVGLSVFTAGTLALSACSSPEVESSKSTAPEYSSPMTPVETPCDDNPTNTSEQTFCIERREGTLGIVVIDDLGTFDGRDFPTSDQLQDAGEYATDLLRHVSNGAIDLNVSVLDAPEGTADIIRERNIGFLNDEDCLNDTDEANTMGAVLKDIMPELDDTYAQVVAFGGDSCDIVENSFYVQGRSAYDSERRFSDVYTESTLLAETEDDSPEIADTTRPFDEEVGSIIGHEIGHNFRFGHAMTLYPTGAQTDQIYDQSSVDIDKFVEEGGGISEYGDNDNFLGGSGTVLGSEYENDISNPVQENFIDEGSFGASERILDTLESGEKSVINDNEENTLGATFSLEEPIIRSQVEFTDVTFVPRFDEGFTMVDVILNTDSNGSIVKTMSVSEFYTSVEGSRIFTLGQNEVTITHSADDSGIIIYRDS
jgi:hypothetical protein